MPTMTETLYSRRIRIDEHYYELQPGDQVDISLELEPEWATVVRIDGHVDDRSRCDGDCECVIYFEGSIGTIPWHVSASDEVYARFPVGGDR